MKHVLAVAATAAVLVVSLAGCSEDDPAVCGSVNDLKASVESAKDIDLTGTDGVDDLKSAIGDVEDDLAQVRTDAKSEFSSQLDAVDASWASLAAGVDAASADPTVATLTAAVSALSTFVTDVQALISEIQATC